MMSPEERKYYAEIAQRAFRITETRLSHHTAWEAAAEAVRNAPAYVPPVPPVSREEAAAIRVYKAAGFVGAWETANAQTQEHCRRLALAALNEPLQQTTRDDPQDGELFEDTVLQGGILGGGLL